jgi:hypothetical protein
MLIGQFVCDFFPAQQNDVFAELAEKKRKQQERLAKHQVWAGRGMGVSLGTGCTLVRT